MSHLAPVSDAPFDRAVVRRTLSTVLSSITVPGGIAVLVVLLRRPSIFLSDGTSGLSRLEEAVLPTQAFWVIAATAALILLAGLPPASSRWRQRAPWVLAIAALCAAISSFVLPLAMPVLSLFSMLFFLAFGG